MITQLILQRPDDEQLLKSIHRLQFSEDFARYLEYLTQQLASLDADNRVGIGPEHMWRQGAAQALTDIIQQSMQVKEHVQRLHAKQRRTA